MVALWRDEDGRQHLQLGREVPRRVRRLLVEAHRAEPEPERHRDCRLGPVIRGTVLPDGLVIGDIDEGVIALRASLFS